MAHNGSLVPWPRPGRSPTPVVDGAPLVVPAAGPAPVGSPASSPVPVTDDVALVLGWLQRCTADPARAEDLTVEVFRRRALPASAWLERAPADVRLRFAVVTTVLRDRGTL